MRYFFDIHLHGKCHLDNRGEEFNSAEEAREYVVDCGRTCMIEGQPHERRTMAQCIIEVTDREGLSDLLTMADVRSFGVRIGKAQAGSCRAAWHWHAG
jgi:hypothetical protein